MNESPKHCRCLFRVDYKNPESDHLLRTPSTSSIFKRRNMEGPRATQTPRHNGSKPRSSFEPRIQFKSTGEKNMVLCITPRSTLVIIVAVLYAHAWFLSIGVCSICVTAFMMESAQDTTLLLNRDHQFIRNSIEELRIETAMAKKNLDLISSSCLVEDSSHFAVMFSSDEFLALKRPI
jgi:hypothetical protein